MEGNEKQNVVIVVEKYGDVEVVTEIKEATAEQPKSASPTIKVPCIFSKFEQGSK